MSWDTVHDARTVFLACMHALCSPGTAVDIPGTPGLAGDAGLDGAAAILLALLDEGLTLGVSGSAAAQRTAARVCELTGATRTDIDRADWVLVEGPAAEAIALAPRGTAFAPQAGATIVIAAAGEPLPMSVVGPGVQGVARTAVALDTLAARAFTAANADSPCGVDLLVVNGSQVTGLPRSVRVRTD